MKKCFIEYPLTKTTLAGLAAAVMLLATAPAYADTSWAHGGNWADDGDNFQTGVIYPTGITSSTTTAQAKAVADTIAADDTGVGINFVRIGINPATISDNWSVVQAYINELVADGMYLDLGFWTSSHTVGTVTDFNGWKAMWQTVDGVYSGNNSVYYEPINEPHGYASETVLGTDVYAPFLGFVHKSQNHIILDGQNTADDVTQVGGDTRFTGCLLGLHTYPGWWGGPTTESGWESALAAHVGNYAGRTIMTEMGAPATSGLNYGTPSSDVNVCFIRGITTGVLNLGLGMVYWPSHRANDGFRLFKSPGGGLTNQSLVNRLQYGWDIEFDGVEDGAAIINSLPTPEIAGVDEAGNVYHKWIQLDGNWSSWNSLGSPTGGAKQWGAIMGINANDSLEVFVTGASDGAVYHAYESSSGWTAFSSLGGGGGNLSSPVVISDNDGRLNLFVVGGDNAIWWNKQSVPGGSWMGWTQITGTTAKSGEAPTVILNAGGDLEVFYNKSDNSEVCHVWQTTSGGSDWTWTGQNSLGGGGNLSGLSATRNTDGRLDVSVVGSDNNVWHNWQTTAGGNWNGWFRFDTSETAVSGQAPCLAVNQSGTLEIFMNGTNGHVYHNWQTTPGGSWHGWSDMGGGNNLTRFWGVTKPNGDLEVFVVGSDHTVWTDSQTSPGGNWSGWSSLFGVYACW